MKDRLDLTLVSSSERPYYQGGGYIHKRPTGELSRARTVKYLCVPADDDLKYKPHVDRVTAVPGMNLGIFNRVK